MEGPSVNGVNADWYQQERQQLRAIAVEANSVAGSETVNLSPSGRYRLIVCQYDSPEAAHCGAGGVSQGKVYCGETLLAIVTRDDDRFYFTWVEQHPNGHDYLLCSEHYQGQTVIELDTGRRNDYTAKQSATDEEFIIVGYYLSPDYTSIVVEACYWGCPWGLVLCRFGDPLSLPWPVIREVWDAEPVGWEESTFRYTSEDTEDLLSASP